LAYEAAVGYFEQALDALDLQGPLDEGRRCELLLALGEAQWRAGETAKSKDTLERAAAIARRLGAVEHLGQAALGYGAGLGGFGVANRADERLVALLEEALEVLPPDDSLLRVRLLARLA